jgi:hypothetical protein
MITLPAVERLLAQTKENDNGCWIYTGSLDRKGYVRVRAGARSKAFGHRITWAHFIGDWPDGLTYDHLCRNKACVNPWHGDPVPAHINSLRAPTWTGNRTECPQGHPYSEDNTLYVHSRGIVTRTCRTCRIAANRQYRARLAEKAVS